MKPSHSLQTYLKFGGLAAAAYLLVMAFFLYSHQFQSLWMLPLGNFLYLFMIGLICGYFYKRNHFRDSSISNAMAGHYVSFTGAAIATLLTLLMFFIFKGKVWPAGANTPLLNAPGSMSVGANGGILPLILIDSGFGNTVCGFFAAIVVSFSAKRNQRSQVSK